MWPISPLTILCIIRYRDFNYVSFKKKKKKTWFPIPQFHKHTELYIYIYIHVFRFLFELALPLLLIFLSLELINSSLNKKIDQRSTLPLWQVWSASQPQLSITKPCFCRVISRPIMWLTIIFFSLNGLQELQPHATSREKREISKK